MASRLLRRQGGFTLIELLVVVLIIGILIAVAAPAFLSQTQKAQDSVAKQELAVAYKSASSWAVDHVGGGSTDAACASASQGDFCSPAGVAAAINAFEPELHAVVGTGPDVSACATDVTSSDPKDIWVEAASGGNLTICNDPPSSRICTLIVSNHVVTTPACQANTGGGSGGSSGTYSYSNVREISTNLDASSEGPFYLRADGHLLVQSQGNQADPTDWYYSDFNPSDGSYSVVAGSPNSGQVASAAFVTAPSGSDWAYVDDTNVTSGGTQTGPLDVVDASGTKTQIGTAYGSPWGYSEFSVDWRGSVIAYSDYSSIKVVAPDGTGMRTIYTDPDVGAGSGYLADVSLSADGSEVAFCDYVTAAGGGGTIYVASTSGSGSPQAITGSNCSPNWKLALSPDGSKIAWGQVLASGGGAAGLYVSSVASPNPTLLDSSYSGTTGLSWSPDSSHIAYISTSVPDGNWLLTVINADGSNLQVVAPDLYDAQQPLWSTNGNEIYFINNYLADGSPDFAAYYEIYAVDVSH